MRIRYIALLTWLSGRGVIRETRPRIVKRANGARFPFCGLARNVHEKQKGCFSRFNVNGTYFVALSSEQQSKAKASEASLVNEKMVLKLSAQKRRPAKRAVGSVSSLTPTSISNS